MTADTTAESRSIDDYIATFSPAVQTILRRIRATIRKAAPAAEETISYRMPAFVLDRPLVYFAAFKNHIGFYPPVRNDARLTAKVARYANEKGNLSFPLDEPIPYRLIAQLVKARVRDNAQRVAARRTRRAAASKRPANTGSSRDQASNNRSTGDGGTNRKQNNTGAIEPRMTARGKRAVLLAGGNPQIAKADGDAPVQAYIAAVPDGRRETARRIDALVTRTVPGVRKAVRWNSPMYGVAGRGWFLSFHIFTRYVKVTFFNGTSLQPVPPGGTAAEARWVDVHEGDFDEGQLRRWIRQAAALPGWSSGSGR